MSNGTPDKSRRQVVFDWLMDDEGYWGGSEEVEQVDALLAALDAHSSATVPPIVREALAMAIKMGEAEEWDAFPQVECNGTIAMRKLREAMAATDGSAQVGGDDIGTRQP